MSTFLIGGGWTPAAWPLVYGPLLEAAGEEPVVACVVLDEGDGTEQFGRWAHALAMTAACTPLPVLVAEGGRLDVSALGEADAVLVCGGLTPAYAAALAPAASELSAWMEAGSRPYAGFSAGAAIAARQAVVGGWRLDGVPVCPEDAGEDLEEVSIVAGLGLVTFSVEVHATQWETLGRLVAAVQTGRVTSGFAIDEDTMLAVDGVQARVAGLGQVHGVSASRDAGSAVAIQTWDAGELVDIASGGAS